MPNVVPETFAAVEIVAALPISCPDAELAPPVPVTAAVATDEASDALAMPAVLPAGAVALPVAALVMSDPTEPAAEIETLIVAPPRTVPAAVAPTSGTVATDCTPVACAAAAADELNKAKI